MPKALAAASCTYWEPRTWLAHKEGAVAQAREQAPVQRPVLARTVDQHEHEAAAHAVQRRPVPDQATARAVSTPRLKEAAPQRDVHRCKCHGSWAVSKPHGLSPAGQQRALNATQSCSTQACPVLLAALATTVHLRQGSWAPCSAVRV